MNMRLNNPTAMRSLLMLLIVISIFGQREILTAAGQHPPGPQDGQLLVKGMPIERELSSGQTDLYRIALNPGQFALLQVEQRGVDVSVAANDPEGNEFASNNLRWGGDG